MFKNKLLFGPFLTLCGWCALVGGIRGMRILNIRLTLAEQILIFVPASLVVFVLPMILGYFYFEQFKRRQTIFQTLPLLYSVLGAGGLILLFSDPTFSRLDFLIVILPVLVYTGLIWFALRAGEWAKRDIEELTRPGTRVTLWKAMRITLRDFQLHIFYELSEDRRVLYVLGVVLFIFLFMLAFGELPASWAVIPRWVFALALLLDFVLLQIILYAEVLEKSGAKQELRIARQVQLGLMPAADPEVKGFDISGRCDPAADVGGDYFDYVWLDRKRTKLGIAIADVSGKAMKAAITAVMTSGMVYSEMESNSSPKLILTKINRPMYFKTDRRMFTTMLFAAIDIRSKVLRFSNAGQTAPILKRGSRVISFKTTGVRLPLGMKEDIDYEETSVRLRRGDVLIFCTDGLVESMNESNEMFGAERFENAVAALRLGMSARETVQTLFGETAKFSGEARQYDDMTAVVVRVL